MYFNSVCLCLEKNVESNLSAFPQTLGKVAHFLIFSFVQALYPYPLFYLVLTGFEGFLQVSWKSGFSNVPDRPLVYLSVRFDFQNINIGCNT